MPVRPDINHRIARTVDGAAELASEASRCLGRGFLGHHGCQDLNQKWEIAREGERPQPLEARCLWRPGIGGCCVAALEMMGVCAFCHSSWKGYPSCICARKSKAFALREADGLADKALCARC
eukprot:227108-Rhodomonas_salina.1